MLTDLLKTATPAFRVTSIREPSHLETCRRTAFAWTQIPGSVCLAMNWKYFRTALDNPNIQAIVAPDSAIIPENQYGKSIIESPKADELFYYLHNQAIHTEQAGGTLPAAGIAPTARVSPRAIIGKNVVIGEDVVIHDGCIVLDNSEIGAGSVLYENVTIGTEGFFSKVIQGVKTHIRHYGGVRIGRNCIIHAGSNISRSANAFESTTLGDHVHIGIHSNVGHDSVIADHCDLSAKVCIAGRARLGRHCWIGASVVISNAVSIGERASVMIGSVVIDDVPDGETVSGNFAEKHGPRLKSYLKSRRGRPVPQT